MESMAQLELSLSVFSILSALIEEKVGLHYGLPDREILQEKASSRALEAGFDSLLDYYYFLRYDDSNGEELRQLTETLVVNETYFFREWNAIETLVDSFITPRCASGRKVKVWIAASSTGEEPLSLAMLLADRNLLNQVEIVATDISARALAKAKSGKFGKRSIRQVPVVRLFEKYLRSEGEGYQVSRDLIQAIRWEQRNLLRDEDIIRAECFDVILCRNVLIYFSDQTVHSVLGRLSRVLEKEGVLLVGVSESLFRYGSSFVGEERGGAFVYRKAVQQ